MAKNIIDKVVKLLETIVTEEKENFSCQGSKSKYESRNFKSLLKIIELANFGLFMVVIISNNKLVIRKWMN